MRMSAEEAPVRAAHGLRGRKDPEAHRYQPRHRSSDGRVGEKSRDFGAEPGVLVKKAFGPMAALVFGFAVAGCAAGAPAAPTVRPLIVQVPVLHETPCPAPVLTDPALPIAGLVPASPPADTMRAYAAAVAILKGAVRERDAVLAGCTRVPRSTAAATPAPRSQVEQMQ